MHTLESIDPSLGGPVLSAGSLAVAQMRAGHDVRLITYRTGNFERSNELLREQLPQIEALPIVCVDGFGAIEKTLGTKARKVFRATFRSADVVHTHGFWNAFDIAAAREAVRRHCRLVIAPRGMLDPWSLAQKRLKKSIALKLVWKQLLLSANFIHALTEDERELMRPIVPVTRVKVFPNGVFVEQFDSSRCCGDSFRARNPAAGGNPYVLFLGRLHHKKGLDFLLDAFAILERVHRDLHLVIAGPDQGMMQHLERWVDDRALKGRVHFPGPLYGAEKLSALGGAACFCLPSRQEGFSMAILEALACGLPVVISRNCHFEDVAKAGAGEVVDLKSECIAEAISTLLTDGSKRAAARLAARSLVASRYNMDVIARELTDAYPA
ncbi:MAG: glycosyltransferase [Nitrospira sp.]